ERSFSLASRPARDIANSKHAFAELDAHATAAHVRPEAHAEWIDLPEAERAGAGANAISVGDPPVKRREVPGHDSVGDPRSPLEIAVAALPGVAENETSVTQVAAPTEVYSFHGGARRRQLDVKRIAPGDRVHDGPVTRPAIAVLPRETNVAGRGLNDHRVGSLTNVDESAWRCGHGLIGRRSTRQRQPGTAERC